MWHNITRWLTWASRSMSRSAETLNSIPVVQCFAIALVSSDCVAKGGSIPAVQLQLASNYIPHEGTNDALVNLNHKHCLCQNYK